MLVFIDESGHPRPNDPTKRPTILAACIEEAKLGQLSRATFALQRSLLSQMRLNRKEREGKASELMNRRALTKNAAKREYAEAFFDRLRDFPLTVFAVVAERPTDSRMKDRTSCKHTIDFFLSGSISSWSATIQTTWPTGLRQS